MKSLVKILSIDGGGIRGILPGLILVALEKKLQEKSNNRSARLSDYFDMFAGTSTGGILTCLYLLPDASGTRSKYCAEEAVEIYQRHGAEIFATGQPLKQSGAPSKTKYLSGSMAKLFRDYFADIKLSELLKPCIIPSYNFVSHSPHFFTQHDAKREKGYDYPVREVALATAAAPHYFEPAKVTALNGETYTLIDGGVFANNPALCAYAEARQLFKKHDGTGHITANDMFIVSVGTGSMRQAINPSRPSFEMTMGAASDTTDYQLKQIFDAAKCADHYHRLIPVLMNANQAMDNVSTKNLDALKEAGLASADNFDDNLNKIADILIAGKKAIE